MNKNKSNPTCQESRVLNLQSVGLPLKNEKVSVIGFGRSGKACTDLLLSIGAKVFISEIDETKASGIQYPVSGIQYEFGKHTPRIFDTSLIIVSPGIPITHPILQKAKIKHIPVIGELEFASRFIKNPIIAITGTNGKSTTAFLIQKVLESAKIDAVVCGNIGVPLSSLVGKIGPRTVPVVEVSTFQLETVKSFHPWIGVFLNLTPDHLDRHKNFDEYRNLKFRLFSNQEKDDFAILNFDDPTIRRINLNSQKWFFSVREPATVWVKDENIFWIEDKLFSIKDINLKWKCLLENYLASILVAKTLKIQNNLILQGLNSFKGIPHRLEDVRTLKGVKFINNSMCTNPVAFARTLQSFKSPVILVAGGKKKNVDITPIAEAINEHAKYVILIGETSRELGKLIKVKHRSATSMQEAVNLAFTHASTGDTVLLSPGFASFDWFRDFRERGEKFKEIVRKLGTKNESNPTIKEVGVPKDNKGGECKRVSPKAKGICK